MGMAQVARGVKYLNMVIDSFRSSSDLCTRKVKQPFYCYCLCVKKVQCVVRLDFFFYICRQNYLPQKLLNTMKTRSTTYQIEQEMAWENPAPGITRQVMAYDGQLMLVKVKFETGAIGAAHAHYHSQATYVASGRFELTIGDEKRILGPGDGYYVEPDLEHGCVCLEAGILIDTFSPMRADFLK